MWLMSELQLSACVIAQLTFNNQFTKGRGQARLAASAGSSSVLKLEQRRSAMKVKDAMHKGVVTRTT
jgi:hypothetical protein